MATAPVTVNISAVSAGAIKNKVAQIAGFSKGLDSEKALIMVCEALQSTQNQLNTIQRGLSEVASAVNINSTVIVVGDAGVTIDGDQVTY